MLDLQKFCETNPDVSELRKWLLKPFSRGDWTYASDGRLIVRVSRVPDVPEIPEAEKAERLFADTPPASFTKAPAIQLPENTDDEECGECDGRGSAHDCPSCECKCVACDGTGLEQPWYNLTFGFGEAVFAARFLRRIKDLPALQFGTPHKEKAMRFAFDGGEGLIMPYKGRGETHIDLDEAKAA